VKKTFIVFIVLIMLSSIAYGNKYAEIDSVDLMDSKTNTVKTYQPINLILKGRDVITDVPGILYDLDGETRTLVPVRFIIEELGASVTWEQSTQTATISHNGKTIALTIDEKYAYVNGEKIELPSGVPAKLMSYNDTWRTMVPIRFISENFNLDIDWLGDTKSVAINSLEQDITGIDFKYKLKFPEIRLKTTGYVDINDYSVGGSNTGIEDKMIFSIPNANLINDSFEESVFLEKRDGIIDYDISLFGIKNLVLSKEQGDIRSVTIEMNLNKKKGFKTFYDERTKELVIQLVNSVDKVYTDDLYNSKALIIETEEDQPAFDYNQSENQITIDVVNSNLNVNSGDKTTVSVNSGGILEYTYYQLDTSSGSPYALDDKVTRVEMTLTSEKSVDDVFVEEVDNKIYAYVSGNPLKGFEYAKTTNGESYLGIEFNEQGKYNLLVDEANNVLEISFLRDLVDIDDLNLDIDDQIVKAIDISKSFDQYVIKIALEDPVTFKEESSSNINTNSINLAFKNTQIINSKYADRLIVIDPGHGGKDPGAIGTSTRTKESDLVLKVGLMLQKQLEAKGFRTYITRDDDRYVDLYQRPNIANKLGADLFVSIHINAFSKPSAQGIEVLYAEDPSRDNYGFARIMQDYLLSYLNRVDRGVVNRPRLVVLKNTMMPAVLAELGFLTNPEEEQLLIHDEYLQKSANAMYKSIIDYLN
jgi:N-acetylmuramoyl-L-alanine amidase